MCFDNGTLQGATQRRHHTIIRIQPALTLNLALILLLSWQYMEYLGTEAPRIHDTKDYVTNSPALQVPTLTEDYANKFASTNSNGTQPHFGETFALQTNLNQHCKSLGAEPTSAQRVPSLRANDGVDKRTKLVSETVNKISVSNTNGSPTHTWSASGRLCRPDTTGGLS